MRMHNAYSVIYNEMVFDVLKRRFGEGEAVVFARAASAGGQRCVSSHRACAAVMNDYTQIPGCEWLRLHPHSACSSWCVWVALGRRLRVHVRGHGRVAPRSPELDGVRVRICVSRHWRLRGELGRMRSVCCDSCPGHRAIRRLKSITDGSPTDCSPRTHDFTVQCPTEYHGTTARKRPRTCRASSTRNTGSCRTYICWCVLHSSPSLTTSALTRDC